MEDQEIKKEQDYLRLNWFQKWFAIPPVHLRPRSTFWISQFAMSGYRPDSVESYILLKTTAFAAVLNLTFMGIVFFLIWPDQFDRFKYDYPFYGFPVIFVCALAYLAVLAIRNRALHNWDFASFRPIFVRNLKERSLHTWGFKKTIFLLMSGIFIMAILSVFLPYSLDYFSLYKLYTEYGITNIISHPVFMFFVYGVIPIVFLCSGAVFGVINLAQLLIGKHPYQNLFR